MNRYLYSYSLFSSWNIFAQKSNADLKLLEKMLRNSLILSHLLRKTCAADNKLKQILTIKINNGNLPMVKEAGITSFS